MIVMVPNLAMGQEDAKACAAIGDGASRLACYDGLFRASSAPDELVSVVLTSEQSIPARPSGRGQATMTVSCAAGDLSVSFGFAGHQLAGTTGDSGVTLQADLLAARTQTLPASPDNLELVIKGNAKVEAFLSTLVGATNLSVRTTPYRYRSLSVRFRVDNAQELFAPVRAACE